MIASGWVEEVKRLVHDVPPEAPAWKSTGYRVIRRLIDGELTMAAAREAVVIETRQYAKRQRTWFRHQLPAERVTTVDPTSSGWRERVHRWLVANENERKEDGETRR
jgi:tRNA dimethylallyltransferase